MVIGRGRWLVVGLIGRGVRSLGRGGEWRALRRGIGLAFTQTLLVLIVVRSDHLDEIGRSHGDHLGEGIEVALQSDLQSITAGPYGIYGRAHSHGNLRSAASRRLQLERRNGSYLRWEGNCRPTLGPSKNEGFL